MIIVRKVLIANKLLYLITYYLIMFSPKLNFAIEKQFWESRAGTIKLNGIEVKTPVFMPVGTKATIKWLFIEMLQNPQYLWDLEPLNIMLSNTFHLHLRPGEKLINDAGGIQNFMKRPWLVLTDSWWFQVFSLWLGSQETVKKSKAWPIVKVTEEGIKFRSPIDGSKYFMSPEDCLDIQCTLWSDIMMVLDVCSPGWSDNRTYAKQMAMTHRRATRQFNHYAQKSEQVKWVLFPIVQWWTDYDLRKESIDYLSKYAIDGIAVWGVSVGESREQIQDITSFCWSRLPQKVPRYLMGIGDVETIRHAISAGFDMFDCVMPTRLWRHGIAYSDEWNINLTNAKFRNDHSPLQSDSKNKLSQTFSKAYIHHLLREREMLGGLILSLHNIFYLHQMVGEIRENIVKKWN